jgi:Putative adhesin
MSHAQPTGRHSRALIACAAAALTLPLLARAAAVDEHRAASAQGAVEIDNVAGSIDVQGWDKSEVAVSGSIGKDVERVEVTGGGDRTSIRVVLPHGHHWDMHDGEANLVIHVPANSSIRASLVSADFKVSAVRGGLELRTVSGNISGESGGDVRANTVSGNIHLRAAAAKVVEIKAISGDIEFTGGNADIEATTVSGDARLNFGVVSRARFKSVSGDFSAALSAAPNAQIEAESVSGDVKLDFATAPDADYDIQTLSGEIDNCFGPKPVESRHGPGSRLNFKTGDGGARIRVSSNSGEVRLCAKK